MMKIMTIMIHDHLRTITIMTIIIRIGMHMIMNMRISFKGEE